MILAGAGQLDTLKKSNLFKFSTSIEKGDLMTSIRQEATNFLDGLVIGFLIMAILMSVFSYTDFPEYSYILALFGGGCIAGLITRGTWRGGISAFFSGFFALFLFDLIKDRLTLEYQFTTYQLMIWFLAALLGGIIGGFFTKSKTPVITRPRERPQKVYICHGCGAEIPMKTKFCPECGILQQKATPEEKIQIITKEGGDQP